MPKRRRILPVLGAAAGGFAAAAALPMALAHADDLIGSAGCAATYCLEAPAGPTGDPTNVNYEGFRPMFEEWTDNQPTNVVVNGAPFTDGISGSYNVGEIDYSTPYVDSASYQFGTFSPAAGNSAGADSEGLSGASVYDFTIGPGGKVVDGQTTFDYNTLSAFLANGDHIEIDTVPGAFTNYVEATPTDSADWIQYAGSSTPTLIYDTLPNPAFPAEVFNPADYLPPDAWLPDISSMFPPGLL